MRLIRPASLWFLAALISCGAEIPGHEEFAVGMTRADISAQYGEPDRTQTLSKSSDAIWGPSEDFWSKVPPGTTVEIWAFRSRLTTESHEGRSEQAGQSELYFVNDSPTVDGIGFYIEGAVYEGR